MSQTEERLFTLMTHAEDLQRVAQSSLQEVGKAVQRMETGTGNAILSVVRAGIDETMQETKTGLTGAATGLKEASDEAKSTGEYLRRTGVILGVFLLAVAVVIAGGLFGVMHLVGKSRMNELAELKAAIQTEQATLDELQTKTWGLELVQYKDGTRGIILPKGIKISHTGTVANGREAVVIKP